MNTTKTNGQGAKNSNAPTTDTAKGAEILKPSAEKEKEITLPLINNPVANRLKQIQHLQALSEKRKVLTEMLNKVNIFENDLDGETDEIRLEAGNGGSRDNLKIRRPETIVRVLNLLRSDLEASLNENENLILNATI